METDRIEIPKREYDTIRAALQQQSELLALSLQDKAGFLANVSTELRTPLQSILILADLLKNNPEGNLTPQQVEFATVIHASSTTVLELINELLALAEISETSATTAP